MKKQDINTQARELQVQIWKDRAALFPLGTPPLTEMFTPKAAAQVIGIQYEIREDLGRFGYKGNKYEVAGMIDRQARKIAVSRRFQLDTMNFTGAHEIGHWLMHPHEVMHRDRPIKRDPRNPFQRPREEREADYFAASFLIQASVLSEQVAEKFQTSVPVTVDDHFAFWLCRDNPDSVLSGNDGLYQAALYMAAAESFATRHFPSLAKTFNVSVSAMAIRLVELGLIRY